MTVLMSVRNGERYLEECLSSILESTEPDFECLVFNDASEDGTSDGLDAWAREDSRIEVIHREEAQGLAANLAEGIERSRGRFIARMDVDDRCRPQRLERQADFLEENPDLLMVGSWANKINEQGSIVGQLTPATHPLAIAWELHFHPVFIHPSVMFRREALMENEVNYDPEWGPGQDYEFWSRLTLYGPVANLPDYLIDYRVHEESQTAQARDQQMETHEAVVRFLLRYRYGERAERSTDIPALLAPTLNNKKLSRLWHQFRILGNTEKVWRWFRRWEGRGSFGDTEEQFARICEFQAYQCWRFARLRLTDMEFALYQERLLTSAFGRYVDKRLFRHWFGTGVESYWAVAP